jgi:hypothetical protein
MGDTGTGADDRRIYQATLSSIRELTGWEPVDPGRASDPACATEVRFQHPRLDGILLVQSPDPVGAASVRALLYQPLVSGAANETPFLDALRWRYGAIVEAYGTPGVDVPADPTTVAVATVNADRTPAEYRQIARELECIALDVAHLHDRLYRTITNTES